MQRSILRFKVRSKSEKIIADLLFNMGIPYRYEPPLRLKDGREWRPDFLVLNKYTRKEYILEHLGMLDDEEYCNKALGKIRIYIQNGIYPGESLIITAETRQRPLSTIELNEIVTHYLLNYA